MTLVTRQAMSDDGGDFISGTEVDKAFVDQVYDQIDDQVHSTTNPTIKPKAITDEVVAARGSKASLDARLDVVLNEDGTLKTQASLVTGTQLSTVVGAKNLWSDSLFYLWPNGDSSAPYGWTLTGTGAAVARAGTGGGGYEASAPADTTKMKWGKFCAKLTYGSATLKLTRTIVAAADFPTGLQGKTVSVAIRCVSSVGNQASIVVDDGVTTTRGGQAGNATYHTGGGAEEWLYCTHTISNTATKLDIYLEVAQAGAAYFGCGVLSIGSFVPTDWIPERWGLLKIKDGLRGNAAVTTTVNESRHDAFELPAILYDTRLRCKTAPATTAIIVRPSKGTATYPYSTNPSIAAAATSGTRRPDGTYANRCFSPGDFLCWDITQIGTGTVGDELQPVFVFMVPMPELELLKL